MDFRIDMSHSYVSYEALKRPDPVSFIPVAGSLARSSQIGGRHSYATKSLLRMFLLTIWFFFPEANVAVRKRV